MTNYREAPNLARETIEGAEEFLTAEQRQLKEGAERLRREIAAKRKAGENVQDLFEDGLYSLSLRFYNANQAMLSDLEAQEARHEAAWREEHEGDPPRVLLDLQRWQNKYSAMAPEDLDSELRRYAENGVDWHPDRVDALDAAIVRAKGRRDDALTVYKRRNNYEKPWRNQNKAFYEGMKLYASSFGEAVILEPDGNFETIEIKELLT